VAGDTDAADRVDDLDLLVFDDLEAGDAGDDHETGDGSAQDVVSGSGIGGSGNGQQVDRS
jgi:hypothetical protein